MMSTKRSTMMYYWMSTNMMKNRGAQAVPQLLPGMQSSLVFIKSYMTIGQSSPVERRSINIIDYVKLIKFI